MDHVAAYCNILYVIINIIHYLRHHTMMYSNSSRLYTLMVVMNIKIKRNLHYVGHINVHSKFTEHDDDSYMEYDRTSGLFSITLVDRCQRMQDLLHVFYYNQNDQYDHCGFSKSEKDARIHEFFDTECWRSLCLNQVWDVEIIRCPPLSQMYEIYQIKHKWSQSEIYVRKRS